MAYKDFRIIFMGTPEFAVASLKALVEEGFNVVAVVTAPDKPAGRGQKILEPDVKVYAKSLGIPILQPEKLKDPEFIERLRSFRADLQVVVAFRMLPEVVWNMPPKGTINLHASLLPQYRGAAPINWAIINGERVTGVTTFFLEKEIDTGKIIFRQEVPIHENDNAGTLHDKLMITGSELLVKTVKAIEKDEYTETDQESLLPGKVNDAPKIYKNVCKINWNDEVDRVYNFIRGLSPYPAAWTTFKKDKEIISVKIFDTAKETVAHAYEPGMLLTDEKTFLKIAVVDGFISIRTLQAEGKKKLGIEEFLRGFKYINSYSIY